MGRVIIQEFTCKNPIEMIGTEAGVCYGLIPVIQRKIISEASIALKAVTVEPSSSLTCT